MFYWINFLFVWAIHNNVMTLFYLINCQTESCFSHSSEQYCLSYLVSLSPQYIHNFFVKRFWLSQSFTCRIRGTPSLFLLTRNELIMNTSTLDYPNYL